MLKTVGIIVVVVLVLLVAFAVLSRYGWNPMERIATPPAPTPPASVPDSVVP